MPPKKTPDEDKWACQEIGTPFPKNTVRAQGTQNMYVALWYKHGKPLMGQAWNESGVVQCSFAFENMLLSGRDIGGTIQVLQYEGNHLQRGFFYEWLKFSDYLQDANNEARCLVRCGNSVPIFWPEKQSLGNLDVEMKSAVFPSKDGVMHVTTDELASMQILMRNTQGGPPHCPCEVCVADREKSAATEAPRVMLSEWIDCREGDDFPVDKQVIRALGRPLKTVKGEQDQYVALWYRHGVPVMGRAWNHDGKIAASFSDAKREYTGHSVGSMSYLLELPPLVAGFDYSWQPFKEAAKHGEKEWHPVHISFMSPCVLVYGEGKVELLGGANLKDEYATAAIDGKVIKLMGRDIQACQILCRKDRDDTASI
uniref:Ig-like domain-containing protein n=1 Tax=Steinernema glaseri TaxID=37863 RepID=A0A1I8ACM9_9BILA